MGVEDLELSEAPLDALVHVAETLLEPQHLLPNDGEAKVAGLDGARVHRAHGNLVHTLSVDAHEGVHIDARFVIGQPLRRIPEWMKTGWPGIVAQPGPRVRV